MLNKKAKTFLIEEINRFTSYHNIQLDMDEKEEALAIEELSRFSLRRKKAILLEAIIWSVVLLVTVLVLIFRKRTFDTGSSITFAILISGSFMLLLRAMYALGRNRKFRLIVKIFRLNREVVKHS
ncbi:hypothetical protein Q0590_02200 [Rhodocytophaga aerolata]|uniref:Uncharacterized protein n=1 Tax=Rhodocytophaga aerolata TaxID=455078 RepID=A0ABT8QYW8_9BACT|nr:hypothetical protein [Rhodocytophaga aerolata]MDO1445040.1 hypothetical protein [Rhodocytophaga aerolata]